MKLTKNDLTDSIESTKQLQSEACLNSVHGLMDSALDKYCDTELTLPLFVTNVNRALGTLSCRSLSFDKRGVDRRGIESKR